MVALRAKFDGQKIELPAELRGQAPAEVLIVYPANEQTAVSGPLSDKSIWDAFGKAPRQRSTEEINEQIRADRDSWEKR